MVQGNDIIMDQAEVGQRVVVVGGSYIGLEAAVKLAEEGKEVSVVDMSEIGEKGNPQNYPVLSKQVGGKTSSDVFELSSNCIQRHRGRYFF